MNCPHCGQPIRDPASYEQLLACLAAKAREAATKEER